MDLDNLLPILSQITPTTFATHEPSRLRALAAARSLVRRLETPVEMIWDLSFSGPALYCALKVARNTGVFERLDAEGAAPKSTAQLAGVGGAGAPSLDAVLLRRLLRHIAAMGIVRQVDDDTWAGTPHSSAVRDYDVYAAAEWGPMMTTRVLYALPEYLASNGYRDPSETPGALQYVLGSDASFYEFVKETEERQGVFNGLMKMNKRRGESNWVDVFPTGELVAGTEEGGVMCVDVGAGEGYDMARLVRKHPEASGRVVFQDQEQVVKAAEKEGRPGLVGMAHDFFAEQPVKGAKAYMLHSILHNWPEEECRVILGRLKEAMRRDYSVLLVNEFVLAGKGADQYATSMDITMGALLSARERTEREWREFLGTAGFQVTRVWTSEIGYEGVVEAVPVW